MTVRKVAATWLHTHANEWLRNGGVSIDAQGRIMDIFRVEGEVSDDVTRYEGILTPGFVNAHTHMELSFFDGVFIPGGSMVSFLRQIDSLRVDIDRETIDRALAEGYRSLARDGQVAYADISNAADTVPFKRDEAFRSVSFVEVFGANAELAQQAWGTALSVRGAYQAAGISATYLTPHAPYSVSHELWDLLMPELESSPILSLHFAETPQEIEFMTTGGGAIAHLFTHIWKRETTIPRLSHVMGHLRRLADRGVRMLLIHCVSLTEELAREVRRLSPLATIVLCPASNLFIEGAMAPIPMLRAEGIPLAIGTDSLSSSPSLSMLDQLKHINRYFPEIPLRELIGWATQGGADACGFSGLGRLEVGTQPGLNLIEGSHLSANSLEGARVTPLASLHGLHAHAGSVRS